MQIKLVLCNIFLTSRNYYIFITTFILHYYNYFTYIIESIFSVLKYYFFICNTYTHTINLSNESSI